MKLPDKMQLWCKRHHKMLRWDVQHESYGCPEPSCTDIEVFIK